MVAIDIAPGTVIGARYRLEHRLGEGGMGVVWAAEDIATGQRCALKLMKDATGDPDARMRFLREGRAASSVRHPNVVGILDVLEPDGAPPAIAMELLVGEPLRAMLRREGKLPLAELARILVPVASAVGAAHALGIVHRDLKPENIFLARGVDGERVVKVLDFGIAKLTALDGDAMRSTGITTGAVLGTPAYMAPEQVFAEKDLDHRADVWALGVILYECLSGVCPTAGDNVGQVLKHVVARPFEPLHELVPALPEDIAQLVARMTARERSERPADLREVLATLETFAGAPGIPFDPPSPLPRTADGLALGAPIVTTDPARAGEIDPLAKTIHQRAPKPRRLRRVAALGGGVAVVLLGSIAAGSYWSSATPPVLPVAAASPLDPPGAKLACPILRASGVEAPAGWLGAAAAALACERARVILGGRPERTLAPAELLDLPHGPADGFPEDPYGKPDARDSTVTAARQRAQAYLDGEVSWSSAGFSVTLLLHRADGREIKRAAGGGRGLYEAVRSAIAPLVGPGQIPRASELEPDIAVWARTSNVDDALGVLDLTFAIAQNAGGLRDECRRFAALSARVRELGPEGQWLCAYTLAEPLPKIEMDDSDRSSAAVATRIRIDAYDHSKPGDVEAELKIVHELFERERTPRGRSLLAGIEVCLLEDPEKAREKALLGIQSEPKNPEGGWCNPWQLLITVEHDTPGAEGAVRAMQAWLPWDSVAWSEPGARFDGSDPGVLRLLRRAYLLSPFDTLLARRFAIRLIGDGNREEARGIAAALRAAHSRVHDVESELILARVEAGMARFGKALEQARKVSERSGDVAGWGREQRFEGAWLAFELAELLGRGRDVADVLVKRFIEPEPPLLDVTAQVVPIRVIAICTRASPATATRCFERFRSLRKLFLAITPETDEFLVGAERYVKRDYPGAARAWQPLLVGRKVQTVLSGAMVEAFEKTDRDDLAERVDREVMKRDTELHGATLGHARAALRAVRRGKQETARQLAKQVIDAWWLADEEPPALARMRRLLVELEPASPASRP
jgi:hypothetical protein